MDFDKRKRYYVYFYFYKDNSEIFYVGKGSGKRCRYKGGRNELFQKAVDGRDVDYVIISDHLTEEEAFKREQVAIITFKEMGYNLTNIQDGGYAPPVRYGERDEECKKHISEGLKRFFDSHPEERKKISDRMKKFLKTESGAEFSRKSLETRRTDKFRAEQRERSLRANGTEEYRKRQSEDKKRYYKEHGTEVLSGKNNHNAQMVEQYNLDGSLVATYDTATEASIATGVSVSKISAVAKGRRKTAGGFVWKYPFDKHITLKRENKYDVTKDKCAKPVIQCDMFGNELREFRSLSEASRFLGIKRGGSNISANVRGKTKSAYGFVWKYK